MQKALNKTKLWNKHKIWLFVLPSLVGMAVFFFVPAVLSLFYAFTDARGQFVWFANFADVVSNMAFRLAARNSLLFIAASVPLNMAVSFLLASALQHMRHKKIIAVVFFWNTFFADNGAINSFLFQAGIVPFRNEGKNAITAKKFQMNFI